MKKIAAVFMAFFFLSGCFASNELSGKEYTLIHNAEQFYPIYLGFSGNEEFYIKSVNDIKGIYNIDGDKLTMTVTQNTKIMPDIQYANLESNLLNALVRVKTFKVTESTLQLITIDNRTFDFRYNGKAR